MVKIKDELELRGIKTAMGKSQWHPTVISHVLKNSFYCGIITYHKEYVPDYLKQKKVKNYGEIEFTQVQGTHEPIVTVEEYERVQRIDEGADVPESVIDAFVTKIVVHPDSFDWYFRFDGDPSDPLRCKIEEKRRTTTKIVVAGVNSPAIHTGNTGRYQGLIFPNKILPRNREDFSICCRRLYHVL